MNVDQYLEFLTELSTDDLVRRLERAERKHRAAIATRDRRSWRNAKAWETVQLRNELKRRQMALEGLEGDPSGQS